MQTVQIKNINKLHNNKQSFTVKGRINPCPIVCNNSNENGRHLFAILFDKTGSIRIAAFNDDCDAIIEKLKTDNVISINRIRVKEVKTSFKHINHKYKLILNCNSIIETVDDDADNFDDFPKYKFITGHDLSKGVKNKTYVDIVGEFMASTIQSHPNKIHKIKVDSFEVVLINRNENIDISYEAGIILRIFNVEYWYSTGTHYVDTNKYSHLEPIGVESPEVDNSSHSFANDEVESTDEIPLTNTSMPNQGNQQELPDQSVTTSNSIAIKRKMQDKTDQVVLKIQKISNSEPSERFQDLFDALLTTIINAPSDDARCDILLKLMK